MRWRTQVTGNLRASGGLDVREERAAPPPPPPPPPAVDPGGRPQHHVAAAQCAQISQQLVVASLPVLRCSLQPAINPQAAVFLLPTRGPRRRATRGPTAAQVCQPEATTGRQRQHSHRAAQPCASGRQAAGTAGAIDGSQGRGAPEPEASGGQQAPRASSSSAAMPGPASPQTERQAAFALLRERRQRRAAAATTIQAAFRCGELAGAEQGARRWPVSLLSHTHHQPSVPCNRLLHPRPLEPPWHARSCGACVLLHSWTSSACSACCGGGAPLRPPGPGCGIGLARQEPQPHPCSSAGRHGGSWCRSTARAAWQRRTGGRGA